MSELLHYVYFLASDEETVAAAWDKLSGRPGMEEVPLDPLQEGTGLLRRARGDGETLSLSLAGHLAVLEMHLDHGSAEDQLGSRDLQREGLEDDLFDAVGESTFLINPSDRLELPGERLSGVTLPQGELAVALEGGRPRLFTFSGPSVEGIRKFVREVLLPLDYSAHEITRMIDYDEEQHHSIVEKIDEMNRRIGQILNRKGKELVHLEEEVDIISDIHAQMTNYNFLLGSIMHRLRGEISRFDDLQSRVIGSPDAFFHDRIGRRAERDMNAFGTTQRDLSRSLNNAKAAVDVVKSRVDLNRSRTNLDLQQQISSLMMQNVSIQEEMQITGIAATMIEFFLVVYYGLGVWKTLAGEEVMHHIPVPLTGTLITLFSLSVVVGTHKTAKGIKEKTMRGVFLWGLVILAMMAIIAGVTVLFAH